MHSLIFRVIIFVHLLSMEMFVELVNDDREVMVHDEQVCQV